MCAYYMVEAINLTIKSIFPIGDRLWSMMSNGFIVLLGILILLTIGPVLKRTCKSFIMVELALAILFLTSFLQGNAQTGLLLSTAFRTLAVSVPIAFHVAAIKNKQILYNTLLIVSYILIPILILVFIMNMNRSHYYSMPVSYALLLPILMQMNEFLDKRRIINLTLSVIGTISILLFGARGPLLGIGMFLALKYLSSRRNIIEKILVVFSTISFIVLLLVFSEQIGEPIINILQSRGIYSRTLNVFARGSILYESGRAKLFAYYLDLVKMKPFLGWGIKGGYIAAGSGPHNMLIGFLVAFGCIFGGLLCAGAISLVTRVFFVKDKVLQKLVAIYCARNIGLFFVSGGFLDNVNWCIFIALCFTVASKMSGSNLHVPLRHSDALYGN